VQPENPATDPPTQQRRLRVWPVVLIAGVVGVAGATWWAVQQGGDRDRVAREVEAGVPLGSSRQQAEAWIRQTYGTTPSHLTDVTANRIQGRTIPECAGVNEADLGGLVFCTVRRTGPVAEVLDRVSHNHVWVYLLLGKDQRVCGYYFRSFDELRELEHAQVPQGQ
jgi:hypothetical protein